MDMENIEIEYNRVKTVESYDENFFFFFSVQRTNCTSIGRHGKTCTIYTFNIITLNQDHWI